VVVIARYFSLRQIAAADDYRSFGHRRLTANYCSYFWIPLSLGESTSLRGNDRTGETVLAEHEF